MEFLFQGGEMFFLAP